MITTILENIKTIGSCVTGFTACIGDYVYFDGPIPASQHFVLEQKRLVTAENSELKNRVIDSQLQTNTVQRGLLRKEKLDRDIELQKSPDSPYRPILQQRLQQIEDDLDTVEKEREALRKEKAQK